MKIGLPSDPQSGMHTNTSHFTDGIRNSDPFAAILLFSASAVTSLFPADDPSSDSDSQLWNSTCPQHVMNFCES